MSTEYFRLNTAVETKSAKGLGWRMQLLVFFIGMLIVLSRRPDALTHPQFFAEDGTVFYKDAYNSGVVNSLLVPYSGYLQTLPRLVASLAALLPILFAPALMNLIGITIQVLPVNVLASTRSATWGSLSFRLMMGFTYLALPNSRELDVVITNAQWHLALLASLLVFAYPSGTWKGRLIDLSTVLISGLTGPFCIFLAPLAFVIWWIRRERWKLIAGLMLAACAVVQLWVVLHSDPAARSTAPLGASPQLLVDILSGHVFLAAIMGSANYSAYLAFVVLVPIAVCGLTVLFYTVLRGKWEIRLFVVFSLLIFGASLAAPLVSAKTPQWPVLDSANGIRYWFFPMLAFVWSLLWWARPEQTRVVRGIALVFLVPMFIGVAKDWEYPAFPDRHFAEQARKFEALPQGASMVFPLYPDGWNMRLIKDTITCRVSPIGFIDQPADGLLVSGPVILQGWVNAPEQLPSVSVYLDGVAVESLAPGIFRKDVEQLYPGGPVRNKGWGGTLDVSKSKPGAHVIAVRAKLKNGCESVLGSRSVVITTP